MLAITEVPTAYAAIDRITDINSNDTSKNISNFTLLWQAFNAIYNYKCDLKRSSDSSNCIICNNRPSEIMRIKCAINSLTLIDFYNIAKEDAFLSLASRIPNTVINRTDYNEHNHEYRGILNIHRTRETRLPVVASINLEHLDKYYSRTHNEEDEKTVRESFAKVIYTIRCNYIHGDKNLNSNNDLEVIKHGKLLLKILVGSYIDFPSS